MTTTRPWFCPQYDEATGWRCPAPGEHDTYSAYSYGCRSGAADADNHHYHKLWRLGRNAPRRRNPLGIQRRIQACHLKGWTDPKIAEMLGTADRVIGQVRRGEYGAIGVERHAQWAPLLERLAAMDAPHSPHSAKARSQAAKKGYLPLLAWDDIDDPEATPIVDEPAPRRLSLVEVDDYLLDEVLNPVGGRRFAECSIAEQDHVVGRLWRDAVFEGYDKPGKRVAERLEIDPAAVELVRRRHWSREFRARQKEAS